MEQLTDWNALWRELVRLRIESRGDKGTIDAWHARASDFKKSVRLRWKKPDSSRNFILSKVRGDSTVLDIGAGTGAWAEWLAPHVRKITAVEPSPSMIAVMRQSLDEGTIENVDIVQGSWPDVSVDVHDFSLCSHAMYDCPDLPAFIRKMEACTSDTCFLLLRVPTLSGVRSEAARHIWGQPLDSPNFTIAYNILLQMEIGANVLMEDTGLWRARTSESLEEALHSMKKFLGLNTDGEHDHYLRQLLQRRLRFQNGRYEWPQEVRSALVYWHPEP